MIASPEPMARMARISPRVSMVLLVGFKVVTSVDPLRCNASNGKSTYLVDTIVRLLGFPLVRQVDAVSEPAFDRGSFPRCATGNAMRTNDCFLMVDQ